jgi:hypothetical protein
MTGQIRWRWGIGAAFALMLVAFFPQAHFIAGRGRDWHGANAISHPDEVAYSAYLASLTRGNPRRFDPYTGRADVPESLFSIQFVPAYLAGAPARIIHLPTRSMFILLGPLCALASSLAIFWFLCLLTRDERFSAAAVLFVTGFGTLVAGQGIIRYVATMNYLVPLWISNHVSSPSLYHLPLLRLYQPAVAFPLFFVFCAFIWLALTRISMQSTVAFSAAAGLLLAALVFSYFYLWTAALAWLSCIAVLWLLARRAERRRTIIAVGIVTLLALGALVPYFLLLARRAPTVDAAQALLLTHRPDLFRFPEILALLALIILGLGVWRKVFRVEPTVLFAAAFALVVFAVFNQQIITGRSLQPIHYQWFIANYCVLVALVLAAFPWWRNTDRPRLPNQPLAIIAALALIVGFGEVWLAASVGFNYNRLVDESIPISKRLTELSRDEASANLPATVLMSDLKLADRLPTDAPQAVLWAPRMLVFPGVTESENRERFFRQLYFLGYDEKRFWTELDHADWNFLSGLFTYERLSPVVSGTQEPITPKELRAQEASYLAYLHSFNQQREASSPLSYVVVRSVEQTDFTNLDRWYQRDVGETFGPFVLYRVKLRE